MLAVRGLGSTDLGARKTVGKAAELSPAVCQYGYFRYPARYVKLGSSCENRWPDRCSGVGS